MATYADGSVIITIDADGKLAIKELENTEEKVKDVGDESEEAKEKVRGFGDEADKTGLKMAALSASAVVTTKKLLDIGSAAVTASTQFDSAFAKTQTIMETATMSVSDMRAEVLDLSRDTAMAATDVSEAVYQAISGSVATQDATAFVNQANQLAVAGFTSLTNATDVLTTALNSYKLEISAVGGVSNVLIQTQNLGKTSVDELSASMGRAISTGSAYGVNLQNLATGYVELTRSGIATAEATTYLSGMLNELGDAGSKVGAILQEQTGKSFGQLMADGWSLGDVLQVLSDSVDGNAEALMGLWSSQEAGKAANAIMTQGIADFNAVVAQMDREMSGATGTTEKAYKTMTETSEFIDKQLSNSVNNLAIAFGDDLRPAVDGAKKLLTGITDWAAEFVAQNPWVASAFAALTAGVGALAIALAAYTLKTKLATSETLKLTAAIATNPIALALTAVAALTVGVIAYASAASASAEETEKLTATSERQRKEIEQMQEEYDALCKTKGKTSAEAVQLKEKIDEETEAFERNKQTVEEYQAEQDAVWGAIAERTDAYHERVDALDEEYASTTSLISRLQELTEAEHQTAAAKEEVLAIVDLINQRMPTLGLTYDTLTGILNLSPEQISAAAESDYMNRKKQADYERLVELTGEKDTAQDAYEKAKEENLARYREWKDAQAEVDRIAGYTHYSGGGNDPGYYTDTDGNIVGAYSYGLLLDQATEKSKIAYDAWSASADALWENKDAFEAITDEIAEKSELLASAAEAESDAATKAAQEWADASEVLKAAHDAAYAAARANIDGQITLFENMGATVQRISSITNESAQRTTAGFIGSLDTQISYLDTYATNMQIAAERGIDQGLLQKLSDGSEESAEILANIVNATDEQIQEMNEKWGKVSEGKDKFAGAMTEYTGVIEDEKSAMVEKAAQIGIDMAGAMTEELLNGIPDFEAAWSAYQTIFAHSSSIKEPNAYASGTNYAERGFALVGENGPEIVYFNGGERVLTADETRDAMRSVYPTAPQMAYVGAGAPGIARSGGIQLRATIAVPLEIDGREFARATAEYNGEEMEFEVM